MTEEGLVVKAHRWASIWHEGQKYGVGRRYTAHLIHVVGIMDRFGVTDENIIAAGFLHDSIEDCEHVTVQVLSSLFNPKVATLVDAVTDSKEGKNRQERHQRALDLIPTVPGALIVKLADQIANIETCLQDCDKRLGMYQKEDEHFTKCLYDPGLEKYGLVDRMWRYRNTLLWSRDKYGK